MADTSFPGGHDAERQRLITAAIPIASLVAFGVTALYVVAELLNRTLAPGPTFASYVLQLAAPVLFWGLARHRLRQHVEWAALGADVAFTAAIASRLFLEPTTTISGTAAVLSLKMVATALLLPWSVGTQTAATATTLLLYAGFWILSGRAPDPAAVLHQGLVPLIAGVLSVVGVVVIDGARRAAFLSGKQLQESEAQLRTLLDTGPDGIVVVADGRIVFTNTRLLDLLGYSSPDGVLGRAVLALVLDEHQAAVGDFLTAARSANVGAPLDTRFVRAAAGPLDVALTAAPLRYRARAAVQVIVRDVTDRKHAELARQHQQAQMAALLEIAKDISGTLDVAEILVRVQKRTAEVVPCDAVATLRWNPDDAMYRVIAHHGVPPERVAEVAALTFPRGAAFGGRVSGGSTVVINDPALAPGFVTQLLAHFGATALVAAPLFIHGRQLGVFLAFSTGSRRFSAEQVQLIERIGRDLAVAFETAELYAAQQEEAEVSGALARVGQELLASHDTAALLARLCRLTTEVLRCDASHTFLWLPEEQAYGAVAGQGDTREQWEVMRMSRFPLAVLGELHDRVDREGLAQVGVAEGDASLVPAALLQSYGIDAAMIVALRRGGRMIGVHSAERRSGGTAFTPAQQRIARGIAQLGSLALDNARLVEELERANRVRSDFVATMSHELRTPLNIILGYQELLAEGEFGTLHAEQLDPLGRATKSARELLELINATLDLSRLEARDIPLTVQDVQMRELIEELAAETWAPADKPALAITWNVAAGPLSLWTDRLKLKMVLKNLIGNAIKFTTQGRVTVSAQAQLARGEPGVEVAVIDTGIGIPAEARDLIFEPFHQADGSIASRYGGVGLGLHIVRRLADVLGATITVESEMGRGSTFRLWVPGGSSARTADSAPARGADAGNTH